MKKYAILIGNNDGLPGVKKDLQNIHDYLKSNKGGAWLDCEIKIFNDPLKTKLIQFLDIIKHENFDFLFLYFSGHGNQKREVQLYLNKSDEIIKESEILYLANKQLTIFDCCRGTDESQKLNLLLEYEEKHIPTYEQYKIRQKYETKILQLPNQQIILYSCSEGEFSDDTAEGGLYTKNIISSAKKNNDEYINVIDVHLSATKIVKEDNYKQNPDYKLPKIFKKDQLIFGIN